MQQQLWQQLQQQPAEPADVSLLEHHCWHRLMLLMLMLPHRVLLVHVWWGCRPVAEGCWWQPGQHWVLKGCGLAQSMT
jgi:hypothetical protein